MNSQPAGEKETGEWPNICCSADISFSPLFLSIYSPPRKHTELFSTSVCGKLLTELFLIIQSFVKHSVHTASNRQGVLVLPSIPFFHVLTKWGSHEMLLKTPAEGYKWTLSWEFFCKTKQVEFIEKHFTHCHSIVSVLDRCGGWGEPFPLVRMCQTQVTEAGFVSRC